MSQPVYRFRFNGPAAAVAITLVVCTFATWLTLVLTKTISVETIYPFLSHLAVFIVSSFLPSMISMWKERRLTFDIQSDPPPKESDDPPP